MITLRKATMDDSPYLLSWRNDPATRQNSVNMDIVELSGHLGWLERSLVNPDRELLVAEDNGIPVGTIRLDYSDENGIKECEFSWTVAPEVRGCGIGTQMAKIAIGHVQCERILARIKNFNEPSKKIAIAMGLSYLEVKDDLEHWVGNKSELIDR
jgi:RimJ/RimL family protein N-acetyltransferase